MTKKIILIVFIILWMGLIFYFSSLNGNESENQSRGFVSRLTTEDESVIDIIDPIIRKVAHMGVYFVLALLVSLLLKEYNIDLKHILLFTFLICLLYAISDEIHQLFVIGRSGKTIDVFIDSLGIILLELLFYLKEKRNFI